MADLTDLAVEIAGDIKGRMPIEPIELGTEDLDTVTTPGNYYQRTTSNATLARHYPVAASGPLKVSASADRTQVQQEYIRFSTPAGERYWRTKAGASWSPWWRTVEATDSRLSDARTPTTHTHDDRYYTKLQTDDRLALRARVSHTHAIGDVSGLQGALDAKAGVVHTHPMSAIVGLEADLDARFANLSSAYDVAVAEGFSGTVQEWLESLVGARGAEGPYGGTAVTDPQVASWVSGADTATRTELDALYAAQRTLTVSIPTDYPTLQSAIDALAGKYAAPGASIVLNIEAGHQPSSGITVTNGDWSRFIIKSVDPEVAVADSFAGDFVRATQARAPRLGTVIDMRDLGGDGYAMWRSSVGHVEQWCGIKNAAGRGLYVTDNSSCFALRSVFTGSGDRNAWITRASTLDAELSDFSANKGGENAIYVSRASRANLETCNITNAFQNALTVTRSSVAANHCNMSGAGLRGIVTDSEVYARDCTIVNAAAEAISADQAAKVTFRDSTISGSGTYGVLSSGSSVVELHGTTVTGSGTKDLGVIRAGVINAHYAKTTLSTGNAPDVADTNVSSLNAQSSQGVVWG